MNKIFNILFFLLILIFFFYTYKYYSSNKNLKVKHYNRKNINQIINNKITDLPVLLNVQNFTLNSKEEKIIR